MKLSKLMWRALRQPQSTTSFDFKRYLGSFERCRLLVQFYYLFLLYIVINISNNLWHQADVATNIEPLWPVFWVQFFETKTAFGLLICFSFLCGILGFLWPAKRFARVLVFIGYLLLVALANSFGKINHGNHALIAVAFIFIWLPDPKIEYLKKPIAYKHLYLTVFWAAQLAVGLFYSMSGFWKILIGIKQLLNGQINTFHPYALATLTASRMLKTKDFSILGWFLVDYPLLGWPAHLTAVYLEFFSVIAAFRPSLHRIWGLGLILFHTGTWLFMDIPFPANMFLLGLIFVLSPFAPEKINWLVVVYNLPLFGDALSWLRTLSDGKKFVHKTIIPSNIGK